MRGHRGGHNSSADETLALLVIGGGGGGGSLISVANLPALTATPTAGLKNGTLAFAAFPGAYYSWSPGSALTPNGSSVIAGVGGNWLLAVPPVPEVLGNQFWTQADWYVDPVAGNDENPGTLVAPVKTIMGGIVAKWGTIAPTIAQDTTIHVLTSETVGQEKVILSPVLVGGHNFAIVGTLAPVTGIFAAGAVTPKLRASPGNDLTVAGFPGGVAGDVVVNTTKGSSCVIDSIAAGVAVLTQPFGTASLTTVTAFPTWTEDDTWAPGDSLQVFSQPILNVTECTPSGGDANAPESAPVFWMQDVHVPDVSGTIGFSQLVTRASGCGLVHSRCVVDPAYVTDGSLAGFQESVSISCYLPGGIQVTNLSAIYGGSAGALGFATRFLGAGLAGGDCILHGLVLVTGSENLWDFVHADGTIGVNHNGDLSLDPNGNVGPAGSQLWGSATLNFSGASNTVNNSTGGPWAACLTLAALTNNGVGTLSSFNGAAVGNPYTPGVAITSANLDTGGGVGFPGLQDPLTGNKFANSIP